MRNWGILVTAFYALVVLLLLSFGMVFLAENWWDLDPAYQSDIDELVIISLIPTAFLVCGQVLLLFLSVDTSWRRLKPQRHAKVTAGLVGIMVMILTVAICLAIATALWGDNFNIPILDEIDQDGLQLVVFLTTIAIIWGIWGVVFYRFSKRSANVVDSAVSWLIKGSVLELLVAIPCHIIVRQREWCCAQYASAYGIAAGIAIMLMAFGPSVLLLYRRKLDEYKDRSPE
jgi:hypothetical protein